MLTVRVAPFPFRSPQYITANIRNVFGGAETLGLSTSVGTKTRSSFEVSLFLFRVLPSRREMLTSDLFPSTCWRVGNSPNTSVRISFTFSSFLRLLVRPRQHCVRVSLGAGPGREAQLRCSFQFPFLLLFPHLVPKTDLRLLVMRLSDSDVPWRSLFDL